MGDDGKPRIIIRYFRLTFSRDLLCSKDPEHSRAASGHQHTGCALQQKTVFYLLDNRAAFYGYRLKIVGKKITDITQQIAKLWQFIYNLILCQL